MFKLLIRSVLCLYLVVFHGEPVYCQPVHYTSDSVKEIMDTDQRDTDEEVAPISQYLSITDSATIPFTLRQVQDRKLKEYQHNPDFAYANDPAYWKKEPPPEPGVLDWLLQSRVAHLVLLILLILVVAYAIFRLAKENSFHWLADGRRKRQKSNTADRQEEESVPDLDKAISRYSEEGNFSLAVRYMYIRLIRTAFEKNTIQFRSSSTNADIVEAFNDPQQARDFRFLATAYEYIFYGRFTPSRDQFSLLQQKFNAFHQNLQD